jgi:hypothetical protein
MLSNSRDNKALQLQGNVNNAEISYEVFLFYFYHVVSLGPLGTAATVLPIVSAPDDRR